MDPLTRTDPRLRAAKPEAIRDAAMKCFAEQGIAATPLRTIAETAGVSLGRIQHYFVTKQQLIESIDSYVLEVFDDALHAPKHAAAEDRVVDAGTRLARLMAEKPVVMDYVGRALTEGGEVGNAIFDGFYRISAAQGAAFAASGLTNDELDPVWGNLLPLILRVGTIMLRPHIERYIPDPLYTPSQTARWDQAVSTMIGQGQLRLQSRRSADGTS